MCIAMFDYSRPKENRMNDQERSSTGRSDNDSKNRSTTNMLMVLALLIVLASIWMYGRLQSQRFEKESERSLRLDRERFQR